MTRRATMCPFRRLRASMLALSLSSALTVSADAAEVTYALTIANGRVPDNMRLIRVKQNEVEKLESRTHTTCSVPLTCCAIWQTLQPGPGTERTCTARATGRFTVEPHIGRTPSGGHAHGDVLVTIEVYP